MHTINDIIIALRERGRHKTHWENCEREHVDCAAIMALQMFKDLALYADAAAFAKLPHDREEGLDTLRRELNKANAKWLSTFLSKQG